MKARTKRMIATVVIIELAFERLAEDIVAYQEEHAVGW